MFFFWGVLGDGKHVIKGGRGDMEQTGEELHSLNIKFTSLNSSLIIFYIKWSVSSSMLAVASSINRTAGFFINARATQTSYF